MPEGTAVRKPRPGAGREPAASALLGWLADARAPRLCVLTGPAGSGKSNLLAWLVKHGEIPSVDGNTWRTHAVAPLAGSGLRGAAWLLADHLGVVARAPGELIASIAEDMRRTVLVLCDLHLSQAAGSVVDQLILPLLKIPHVKLVVESRSDALCTEQLLDQNPGPALMDLSQPRWTDFGGFLQWGQTVAPAVDVGPLYPYPGPVVSPGLQVAVPREVDDIAFTAGSMVRADPHAVTAWLEHEDRAAEMASDLGRAWLRAGQALCGATKVSTRALTLLAALDSGRPSEARSALEEMTQPESWRLVRTYTLEGGHSGWPGPVSALATGRARHAEHVLCADFLGAIRLLDSVGGTARGRLSTRRSRPAKALMCLPDGTATVLDEFGGVSLVGEVPQKQGLQALLEPESDPWSRLREAVLAFPDRPDGTKLTAAASLPDGVVFGDATGHVHVLSVGKGGEVEATSQLLHNGPVEAVTGLELNGTDITLVYSGGVDGRIRAWSPAAEPMPEPLRSRSTSLAAISASTSSAHSLELIVAWADGLVEYMDLDSGTVLPFRPGPPVRAVCSQRAATGETLVVIGMDEAITALVPNPSAPVNGS